MNNLIYIIAIILIGCGQSSNIREVDRKAQDATLDEINKQEKEIEEIKKDTPKWPERVLPQICKIELD